MINMTYWMRLFRHLGANPAAARNGRPAEHQSHNKYPAQPARITTRCRKLSNGFSMRSHTSATGM